MGPRKFMRTVQRGGIIGLYVRTYNVMLFPLYYEYIKHRHELIDKAIYCMVTVRGRFENNYMDNRTISNHTINNKLTFFPHLYFLITP